MPSPAGEPPGGSPYRHLRICSGGGGFEAIPVRPVRLDLPEVRRQLELRRVPVVDARVMLIATWEIEVTLSQAGRILFKTRDEAAAARAFGRLLPLIEPTAHVSR